MTEICCGLLGTLGDQLNVNGGVPEEINAVILPSAPLPQEVEYKLKSSCSDCSTNIVWI